MEGVPSEVANRGEGNKGCRQSRAGCRAAQPAPFCTTAQRVRCLGNRHNYPAVPWGQLCMHSKG